MKILRRKLILSLIALATIIVCLTSTTYAWFAKNDVAYISLFEIEIENYDGLLVSVDGKSYSSRIQNDELKRAIIAKKEGLEYNDPLLTEAYIKNEFEKFRFADVTTNDLINFKEVDSKNHSDGFYEFKDASQYHYVKFDLYFQVDTGGSNKINNYDLMFVNEEVVDMVDAEISYIKSGIVSTKATTEFSVLENNELKTYNANDEISFDPADAMRLGLINKDTEGIFVYEPNQGYSSYALENGSGIYNPDSNLAFKYLNAYSKYGLKPLTKNESDKFDYEATYKSFSDDVVLGSFEINNGEYNTIKLEVSIWLEGFDGDYISGASMNPVRCYFSFYKKLKEQEVN